MNRNHGRPAPANLHPMAIGAAGFAFILGAVLIVLWAWLVLTGNLPDYDLHPIATTLRAVAEFATGIALLIAGFAIVARKSYAHKAYLVAAGMLLYSLVQAAGYYAENGPAGYVVAFVALMVLAVFFAIRAEQ